MAAIKHMLGILGFIFAVNALAGESSPAGLEEAINNLKERKKRGVLDFPPGSVFQFTVGMDLRGHFEQHQGGIVMAIQQNAKLPQDILSFALPQMRSLRNNSIYEYLIKIISGYGYNGFECLKKMICQIAEAPLLGGDLLEELLTLILSPSKHVRPGFHNYTNGFEWYLEAETMGKEGRNCSVIYSECITSPLDYVSHVFI